MVHKQRIWTLARVASAEELAEKLAGRTWTMCSGFALEERPDLLFLNDSFSEDGAQEYAVVRREGDDLYQVESITFGWMDRDEALVTIRGLLAGAVLPMAVDKGGVVVSRSIADLREALGAPAGEAMHVRVTPCIEGRAQHRGRSCCA